LSNNLETYISYVCRMMKIGILFLLLQTSIALDYDLESTQDLEEMCLSCECACELLEARQKIEFLKKMKAEAEEGCVDDDWIKRMNAYDARSAQAPARKAYREFIRQNRTNYQQSLELIETKSAYPDLQAEIPQVDINEIDVINQLPHLDTNYSISTDTYGFLNEASFYKQNESSTSMPMPMRSTLFSGLAEKVL